MEYSQMPVGCPWGEGKVGGGVVEATNLSERYCKPILNNSQQKNGCVNNIYLCCL